MRWRVAKGWKARDVNGVLRRSGEEISLSESELKNLEKRGVVERLYGADFPGEKVREEVTPDGAAVSGSDGGIPDPEGVEPDDGRPAGRKPVTKKGRKAGS